MQFDIAIKDILPFKVGFTKAIWFSYFHGSFSLIPTSCKNIMRKVLPFLNTSTYYNNESAIQTKCVPTTQDKHYTKMA